MTDSTLRTAIARAISPDWWSDSIAVENREVKQEISLEQADAVLSVLADLPETVIERAARELRNQDYPIPARQADKRWRLLSEFMRDSYRDTAKAVLRAAFGGEQSE